MPETTAPTAEPSAPSEVVAAPVSTEPSADSSPVSTETAAEPSVDDVYETAAAEMLKEDAEDAGEAKVEATAPAEAKAPEAPVTNPITESEIAVLKRAGYDDDEFKGWDRAKIESKVTKLRTAQAEQDRIGAEYARLKQSGEQPKPEAKPEAKAPETKAPTTDFGKRLAEAKAKAISDYDEGIAPVFDLVSDLAERNEALSQQNSVIPMLTDMMGEIALDMAMQSLKSQYPSLDKPEARKQVMDRFWTEFNTGAYNKPGVSIREQMASALSNAAKVTFLNLNENTAVANLVNANKSRLAGQPKAPSSSPRKGPLTKDDVYAEAFRETLGKEMAGR